VLCLDISASMVWLYRSGSIQLVVERAVARAAELGALGVNVFLFGERAHRAGFLRVDAPGALDGYVTRLLTRYPLEGACYYSGVMGRIRAQFVPDGGGGPRDEPSTGQAPVQCLFVTDGDPLDARKARLQLGWSSYEPVFWQFVAIGRASNHVEPENARPAPALWGGLTRGSDFPFLEELELRVARLLANTHFFSVSDPAEIPEQQWTRLIRAPYEQWVQEARRRRLVP
jgi:hypothetical protein